MVRWTAGYARVVQRTVLITGAGSGIGLASAVEAARLGFSTVAAVHRPDQADDVRHAARAAGTEVATEVLDVTDDERAGELIRRLEPWALVNNAGYLNPGLIEDVSPEDARRQFDTMVFAPMRLAQHALPGMRRQGGGRIVNVSSALVGVGTPFQGWYTAAKQAIAALSDALRVEVAPHAVEVVVVEPGAVETPLWDKAREDLVARRDRSREPERYDHALAALEQLRRMGGDPDDIAQVVGATLHAGRPRYRYQVGTGSLAMRVGGRLVPTSVRDRVTRTVAGLR